MLKCGWYDHNPEFNLWSFGPGYKDLLDKRDGISLMNRWNERHGDLLRLKPGGIMSYDHGRMMKLWEESKTGESRDYP